MVYSVEKISEIIAPIARKYHIPAVYLFGSYARGEAGEDSDMDFLIDTAGTELTSQFKLDALCRDLEEAFGKEIDLVTVSAIMQESEMPSDEDFRKKIMDERILLLGQNRTAVFLEQCALMDALPLEKREEALSFAKAMTALEGLSAKTETEHNLQLWAKGEKKFSDFYMESLKSYHVLELEP